MEIPLTELPLDDLGAFRSPPENWRIVGGAWAELGGETVLHTEPGTGVLVNMGRLTYDERQNLLTEMEHGDLELELEYMVPEGSNSGVFLQGRYEVQIRDSWGRERPTFADAGGIYQRWDERRGEGNEGYEGHAPRMNVSRAPGLWQHLRIIFQSPRFNARGEKIANARFVRVEHNGVVVHDNVEVTGPTTRNPTFLEEQPFGPLIFQGDHGPVALRAIRYKHRGTEQVRLSDLRYELRKGQFTSLADARGTAPVAAGSIDGLRWDVVGGEKEFALSYAGMVDVPETGDYVFSLGLDWIDGDPHLQGKPVGGGEITVGNRTVLVHPGTEYQASSKARLVAGTYPFTLSYFKNLGWGQPIAALAVEGPRVDRHMLNAPGSLPEDAPIAPIAIRPTVAPHVQRSFMYYGDRKLVDVASVGDPSGVHYALDLDGGALLYVWRGAFLDASAMWFSRGYNQTAEPLGGLVDMGGAPALAVLSGPSAAWPDSIPADAGYRLDGYTLDEEGRPAFRYTMHGVTVTDRLIPDAEVGGLRREISVEGRPARGELWVRAAGGEQITKLPSGLYNVDGRYYISVPSGARPAVRTQGDRQELLIPVQGSNPGVSYSIIW